MEIPIPEEWAENANNDLLAEANTTPADRSKL